MNNYKIVLTFVVILLLQAIPAKSQKLISMIGAAESLQETFQSAFEKGTEYGNFWIGYSIVREKGSQISIGSFYIDDNLEISLRDLIENSPKLQSLGRKNGTGNIHKSFRIINGRVTNNKMTDKETAVLFRYDGDSINPNDFAEISICNLAYYIDFDNYPLIWLGTIGTDVSYKFITGLYTNSKFDYAKEELLPAAGIHSDMPETTTFLDGIYKSDENNELRADALFWLGQQDNYEAFDILKSVIKNDPSDDMKEKAVTGLSQLNLPEALDELISIAKKFPDMDVRKKAITWLGQKAVKKAEEELKGFIENDPDIEIKKRAVFALANNSDDNIEFLIELANSNKNVQIRKNAIWALGSMDDFRAVDALIKLAKGENQ